MRLRAVLLIAILLGGAYTLIQTRNEYKVKMVAELFETIDDHFISLTFNKPATIGSAPRLWIVEDEIVVNKLVGYIQNYHVQKLKPEEQSELSQIDQFSFNLETEYGNEIQIIAEKNLIIVNSLHYYEIVDGPLEADWIIEFFINNKIP